MAKKPRKPGKAPAPNFPPHHPTAVALEADGMPWKTKVRLFEVEAYVDAISKLYDRGYSYGEITDWLNEKLADKLGEKKIKRGQVYRVYQQHLQALEDLAQPVSVADISDEDAEKGAEESDSAPRRNKEKEP